MPARQHDHSAPDEKSCAPSTCPGTSNAPCPNSYDTCVGLGQLVACANLNSTGNCACWHRADEIAIQEDLQTKYTKDGLERITAWAAEHRVDVRLCFSEYGTSESTIINVIPRHLPDDISEMIDHLSRLIRKASE